MNDSRPSTDGEGSVGGEPRSDDRVDDAIGAAPPHTQERAPSRFDRPALWIAPGILAVLLSIWFGIDLGPAACCSIHPAATLLLAAGCARILWMMMHSRAGASGTWILVASVLVLLFTGFPPLRQQLQEHAHLLRYRSE